MNHASESEAREFAAAFRSFLEWIYTTQEDRNEVVALIRDYLGEAATGESVVTRSLPVFEQVNLQTAWAPIPRRWPPGVAQVGCRPS